jgi:tetratricopeptide (TPR) repeat protein
MRTQEAFKQFLLTLAASEAGQSYDSLQWAGESLLGLNMPKEAGEVLGRVLEMATKDPSVLGQQGAQNKLLRTRLKLVAAAREEGRFEDAREQVEKLVLDNPRMLDPLLEKGMVIEAQAAAENSKIHWEESLRYWKDLATRLQQSPQRRVEAFEAWYHAAIAMQGLGQKADAAGMLRGIMTLTPSVGSSEMKAKYEDLLRKLGS